MNAPNLKVISQHEIRKHLPHRAPILLVNEAYEWTPETLTGIMRVKRGSRWFKGHFPGKPTLPGVVMIEAMAQTAALHVGIANRLHNGKAIYYFLSIENARFRQSVTKPCDLLMNVRQLNRKGDYYKYEGKVYTDVKPAEAAHAPAKALVAEATFMAKLVLVDKPA